MLGLGRLLPLILLAGAAKEGTEKIQPIVDYTTRISVQSEMNVLSRMVLLDYTVESEVPTAEEFPAWVRKSARGKGERDPAKDLWGTLYRIERGPGGLVIIISAGKDKQYKTADDLKAQIHLD